MKVYVLLVTWFSVLTVAPCQRGVRRTTTTTTPLPPLNLQENLEQIEDIITRINDQQALWKAGRNFGLNTTWENLVDLLGVEWQISQVLFMRKMKDPKWPSDREVPEFFDAREKWKNCTVIGEILDQSQCGSCWAMAPAQVATDRYCIASGGRHNIRLSTQEILDCTLMRYKRGCKGGMPAEAYQFIRKHGLVSGGIYGSDEGCQTYFMPKCAHHNIGSYPPCVQTEQKVPICRTECTNMKYTIPLKDDIRKFDKIYKLGTNEKWIQKDIMTYGPISTQFQVHEDFFLYRSGVYEPLAALYVTPQGLPRGHTLKIIGWGTEKGIPYWLCVNTWNEHWGDHGLVKMRRRSPILLLELLMYSTLPTIDPKFFSLPYQPQPRHSPVGQPYYNSTVRYYSPTTEKHPSNSTEKPQSDVTPSLSTKNETGKFPNSSEPLGILISARSNLEESLNPLDLSMDLHISPGISSEKNKEQAPKIPLGALSADIRQSSREEQLKDVTQAPRKTTDKAPESEATTHSQPNIN